MEKQNLKTVNKNENKLKGWLLDENLVVVQIVFLKLFTLIYITAFTSVFVQIPGLFGKDGLLPVSNFLKKTQKNLGPTQYNAYPTIFWLSSEINSFIIKIFPSLREFEAEENVFHLICLVNITLGLCILLDFQLRFFFKFWAFFVMWASYLSIFLVGQSFLSFDWDLLILETGFLAMFFVPNQRNGHFYIDQITVVARELLRWLMFRFMFANGVVKLLSGDKTWWSLTALHYHFENQPLPSPYSRYWHFFPDAIKQFGVANILVVEIFLPILFYSPLRSLRIFSAIYQIPFQILLLSTGNWNWLDFHTIILCLPLLDDRFLKTYTPKIFAKILGIEQFLKTSATEQEEVGKSKSKARSYLETLLSIGVLIGLFAIYFPYDPLQGGFKINFDMAYLRNTLINSYPLLACVGLAVLFTFFNLFRYNIKSVPFKTAAASKVLKLIFSVGFFCLVFFMSLPPFFSGIEAKPDLLPVFSSSLHGLSTKIKSFHIVNQYGLFRHMTGVEGRSELIIQGSYDQVDWMDYEFIYKPGDLNRRCKFNTPHQPRLDWQMWFAALGEINREPWLVNMMGRLFSNSPSVSNLLEKNPFEEKPPQYLRIMRYKYTFAPLEVSQEWKILDPKGEEYFWSVNRTDPALVNYIKGYSSQKITEQSMYPVHPWQKIPILSIVFTAVITIFLMNMIKSRGKK